MRNGTKRGKFQRLILSILLVFPFILFQGSESEGCSECEKILEENLQTQYGTVKVVNFITSQSVEIRGRHTEYVMGEGGMYFNFFFNITNGESQTRQAKVKAGIYYYGWNTFNMENNKKDKVGSGKVVVPEGGTVTIKIL